MEKIMTYEYRDHYSYGNSENKEQYDSYVYNYTIDGDFLVVNGKRLKVIEDYKYIFKVGKRAIKARGGANGLYTWMVERNNGFASEFVHDICRFVSEYGK